MTFWMQIRRSPSWAIPPQSLVRTACHQFMVGLGRLELPTSRLSGVRSNHLSYKPLSRLFVISYKPETDAGTVISRNYLSIITFFLWKEVIQPHLPIRLPCYDFTPVTDLTVATCPRYRLAQRLQVKPTPMVWRAVCTRPGNVFTAACWSAITSDSNFMHSSCRVQSELRLSFRIRSPSQAGNPL